MQLLQGDCLEVMKQIPNGSVDMVLCDLPYGTTACKWDSVISLPSLWQEYNRLMKPRSTAVFTSVQPFTTKLIQSNFDEFKYCWIWEKNRATNFPNAKRRPLTAHEEIVVFVKGKAIYYPQKSTGHTPTHSAKGASQGTIYHGDKIRNYEGGDTTRYPRTVLRFNCERGFHPTQKPIALMEYLIRTYSKEGETVLDNCMGSGSTGVACANTGREFIGIEQDAIYFQIAKSRIDEALDVF